MNELDDVLAVKRFVEDYLTKFYGEKPVSIDLVKAVKVSNIWDLTMKVRIPRYDYGLKLSVDALRGLCVGHVITSIARVHAGT